MIETLPVRLAWRGEPPAWQITGPDSVRIEAGARTDLFADPGDPATLTDTAPALLGPATGADFRLSARVTPRLAAAFDAGVLLLHRDERSWAKLCFEFSPQRRPMVVSVVTRGVSDDCNGVTVDGDSVWLRVARRGGAFAFHASTDGTYWHLVRHFALDGVGCSIGFLAQSPTGDGCAVEFDRIAFTTERLDDLRDGS